MQTGGRDDGLEDDPLGTDPETTFEERDNYPLCRNSLFRGVKGPWGLQARRIIASTNKDGLDL